MTDKTPPVIKDELAADIDQQAHKHNAERVRRHLGEAEQALTDEFHTLLADAEQ
ncbi:membrane protein, partial [Pseudomonas oryzihabitans]